MNFDLPTGPNTEPQIISGAKILVPRSWHQDLGARTLVPRSSYQEGHQNEKNNLKIWLRMFLLDTLQRLSRSCTDTLHSAPETLLRLCRDSTETLHRCSAETPEISQRDSTGTLHRLSRDSTEMHQRLDRDSSLTQQTFYK